MDGYYVMGVTAVPFSIYKCIKIIVFKEEKTYLMTVAHISQSSCLDFAKILSMAMGKRGQWVSYKKNCIAYSSICARLTMPSTNSFMCPHSTTMRWFILLSSRVWRNKLSSMKVSGTDFVRYLFTYVYIHMQCSANCWCN
jgi:hypothetical protein